MARFSAFIVRVTNKLRRRNEMRKYGMGGSVEHGNVCVAFLSTFDEGQRNYVEIEVALS